jgi:hypothetical protein
LLILGALYFVYLNATVVLEGRTLTARHIQELPDAQTFTRKDVENISREAVSDFAIETAPKFLIGAALMLCGGIILDVSGRRKRV